MTDFNEDVFYLLVFSIAMTNLRYTSFALDWVSKQKRDKSETVEVKIKTKATQDASNDGGIRKSESPTEENRKTDEIPVINEPDTPEGNNSGDRTANNDTSKFHKEAENKVETTERLKKSSQDDNTSSNKATTSSKHSEEAARETMGDEETKVSDANEMEVKYSLLDMLSYCLYLPYYFTGPITTYDEFYKQVRNLKYQLTD